MEINKALINIAKALKVEFTLNDKSITSQEVFSDSGLLPAFARRADQLSSLCLGYGIGLTFEEATGSLLGVKVIFDDITPNTLRLICLTDILSELINASPSKTHVSLDELMYD